GGILDLSHPMIPEAAQGTYKISASTNKGEQISHAFEIKEYVLPKYEVKVQLPGVITVLDQEATLTVCGKYTYGKPVMGSVKAEFCRHAFRFFWHTQEKDICKTYELTTEKNGCASQTVNLTDFALNKVLHDDSFEVNAEIEEFGTGNPIRCSIWTTVLVVEFRVKCRRDSGGVSKKTEDNEPYVVDRRGPEYRSAHHHAAAFYSKSRSFLKLMQAGQNIPCDQDATLRAQYIIQGLELKPGQEVLDFFYLVCYKFCDTLSGLFTSQEVTDLAPFAQVVVYTVMASGEAVADSKDFPIQLCLKNKVSLKFSSVQKLPAEKTTLSLQAQPGSLCSVRAIDQSVLLLKSEQELSVDHVCDYYYFFLSICSLDRLDSPVPMAFNMMPQSSDFLMKGKAEEKKETIRTFFPETWIWDLVPVGDSGSADVEKMVPDTITKWAAGAFCVSSVGFGVSPNVGLTVFQPFFVSLTLPYSVIRGEVFTLKATVFNYLSKCIMVKVTLASSDNYSFRDCDGCQYSVCLCGEESRTFSWIVTPTALGTVDLKVSAEALRTDVLCGNEVAIVPDVGQIDTVVRPLLVEAEGTPQMVSHNALLCPADGPVEKKISLLMPEMFVAGSARASVSVLGDLMGRAMKNVDRLLAMPYGCGEQNMVKFAPNIFILNYLKSTGQLTDPILDKAARFLKSGYQRELSYKHDDGSYSAFGKSDDSGNTWLTAFVMKSFGGARPFIFVDPAHIENARRFLMQLLKPDGCIRSVGKLFHNGMKGGVSDDVSLTAYVTAAMLELDANAEPTVQRCLLCLKEAVASQLDNLYTTALMAYTFSLAGDQDMRSKLLTYLHQKSHAEGDTRHWERAGASGKGLDSLEVEMTSYVLLALLSGPAMPDFNMDYSSSIVRWLAQKQNPYGGFSSTQDTVVALQALAKYGAAAYSADGSTTVTVTSLGGLNKEFTVDQTNRLLYQEEKLSEVPGEYTITARGQSCVQAQVSHQLGTKDIEHNFHVARLDEQSRSWIDELHSSSSYQGNREETNMMIINIKLLSGYILDQSSLKMMRSDRSVKRVDVEEGHINIYLDGVRLTLTCQDQPVRNLKPAVVKVYDYYQTSDEAVAEYTSPCAESKSLPVSA
uniref:Alpha-2-macroglobulin-like 1 n=1 Tax=Echeneis naucrates TaxID=173247 RepID=A0A665VQF5_ECHNA